MRILLVLIVSLVNTSFLFGLEPVSFEKRLDGVDIYVGDLHVAEYVHSEAANLHLPPLGQVEGDRLLVMFIH